MRRMRTGLLLAMVVTLLGAMPLAAQVAPTLTGETGLIELTNAETLPAGRFSFGTYYSLARVTAAPPITIPGGIDDPMRYDDGKVGLSIGYGALPGFELTFNAGFRHWYAEGRDWAGNIGGKDLYGYVRHNESDKIRLGAKLMLNQKSADAVKIALLGGWTLPMQSKSDPDALTTYRSDWDFGFSGTYGAATLQFSYLLAGDTEEVNIPNEMKFGLGFNIKLIKNFLRILAEINRTHFDGAAQKPEDYSELLAGARIGLGESGLVATGALRLNIDRWVHYGWSPTNLGGVIGLSWQPQPPGAAVAQKASPMAAAAATQPPPPPEPAPVAPATAPAPSTQSVSEMPPAPKPETSTTDEILFDPGKSRLTNIAKAILDGVALRLKNNLSASCAVTGFTDPKEKGGDHATLAKARAEAAKDYLVKRHGIDASRIKTDAKGDAEAGADATRNRRAVVTVSFP